MPNAFSDFANITGRAIADLAGGFGGQQLQQQQQDETEEEKKRKRLLEQQRGGVTSTGPGSVLGGLSVPALFGNYGR